MPHTKTAQRATGTKGTKSSTSAEPKYQYARILARALSGEFGQQTARFYQSAVEYHARIGTTFPRQAYANAPLLSVEDATDKLRQGTPQNAFSWSRRLFDEMMVQRTAFLAANKKA